MIIYYDAAGTILCAIEAASDPGIYPPNPGTPLYLDDADWPDVWTHPGWYLIQNGVPVTQPAWSVAATAGSTSGQWTVTATLNNPPSTPPTQATFTVAAGTLTAALSSSTASAIIALHETVADQPIPITVSASGTVSGSTVINSGTAQVPLQLITSTTTPLVAPVAGEAGRAWCRAYYLGLTPETQIAVLTRALQALAVSQSVGMRLLTNKILPALQASTYTPITLSSAEQAALSDWQTTVEPYLMALADLLDSGGHPIPAYSELQAEAPAVQSALGAYNTAVRALGL